MKFKVVSSENSTTTQANAADPHAHIQSLVDSSPVFLFMKGTPDMPQCGFSAKVTQILRSWGVPFESFNVLSDNSVREGVKSFSNWPTIPQLYVNKEFIGGCDIITELSESGELLEVLQTAYPDKEFSPPPPPAQVKTLTPEEAAEQLKSAPEVRLIDVRSPEEWEIVRIEGAQLIDQELVDEMLSSWDRNTPIMLLCHHGMRSFDAARFFTSQGFQDVSNIEGGIDKWAVTTDPELPRY